MVVYTIKDIQGPKDKGNSKDVFGVYDYTNDQIWTDGYKKKTGKQFLDFIKRADQKYDYSIKHIFLVLDNVSIHKSNKVKETIARYHPRIQLVLLLPTRSPELNLIEVSRWLYGCIDKP